MQPIFERSLFICSKPLQFLNCASIVRSFNIESPTILILTTGIAKKDDFLKCIREIYEGKLFKNIIEVNSYQSAAKMAKDIDYQSLFVEDDRVSLYNIFKKIKRKYLIVFEEGFGSYFGHYKYILSPLRYTKWKLLSYLTGCGLDFGKGRKTDFVCIQYREVFKQFKNEIEEKLLCFPGHIKEIRENSKTWANLINSELNKETVENAALILGTWDGANSKAIKKIMDKNYDSIIYKPHPHDKSVLNHGVILSRNPWIPAEVYIDFLSKHAKLVTVFHYSSSVEFYSDQFPENVSFSNLNENVRYALAIEAKNKLKFHG